VQISRTTPASLTASELPSIQIVDECRCQLPLKRAGSKFLADLLIKALEKLTG
jgi:hypothetical protein